MPRTARTPKNNGGTIGLEIEVERTLGVVGGIRTDASATVGIDAFLGNNKANGYIDPDSRSGGLNVGVGSTRRGLGGEVQVNAQFNENGSINSIGGNIQGSFLGFGGGIGGDSAGGASISGQAFGIQVEVARDRDGSVTLQTCFGIGIFEACTTFGRDKGDPQNTEGTIKGGINFGGGDKPSRPNRPNASRNSPNDTNRRDTRKKAPPKADAAAKPKSNPRPKTDKPNKPKTDKKPQLDPKKKPVGFGKKPAIAPKKKTGIDLKKKEPINIKKKPNIDLGKKKPNIDLGKKNPNIDLGKKNPNIDLGKKKPIDPSPINLKKPIAEPLAPKILRPEPGDREPISKIPRPPTAPKLAPPTKPPRLSPSPAPGGGNCVFTSKSPVPLDLDPTATYSVAVLCLGDAMEFIDCTGYMPGSSAQGYIFKSQQPKSGNWATFGKGNAKDGYAIIFTPPIKGNVEVRQLGYLRPVVEGNIIAGRGQWTGDGVAIGDSITVLVNSYYYSNYWTHYRGLQASQVANFIAQTARGWKSYEVKLDMLPKGQNQKYVPICPAPQGGGKRESPRLPNQPTRIKPMDCCKKVDEIYKYLGIAKMKRDKFKVAKAFMVGGGKGNEECKDYYAVTQALFRMLANGLIINPISSPNGNDWQNVNATAWAAQMYEMMAESMSDGNSSQKFEMAAIMQLAQLMSTLAETSRKVEYVVDAIGYDPLMDTEYVPISFTIHESHKGFDPKNQPQKIDITKSKTDDEVEAILAKMLAPSKIPIVKWSFDPNNISISKALRAL
jgi:hypothetical protein